MILQMYIWSIASPLLKEQHTAALWELRELSSTQLLRQIAKQQSQNRNDKSTADNASSREPEEWINVSLATDLTKGWMSVKLQLLYGAVPVRLNRPTETICWSQYPNKPYLR